MGTPTTWSRRQVLAGCGSLALASTLGGCSGDGSGDASQTDDGLPDRVEVTMTSTPSPEFQPRLAHVAVGGTVVWTLDSGSHDTTAYHPDTYGPNRIPPGTEPWQSPKLSAVGETYERTFDTEGVYDYVDTEAVCIAHEVIGNVGRVVVGQPDVDPEAQPALRPPQAELPSIAQTRIEDLNEQTRALLTGEPTPTATPDQ